MFESGTSLEQDVEHSMPDKCAHCKNDLTSYFEVSRVNANGKSAPKTVKACSVLCLIQWAYKFGVTHGIKGLMQAKNLVAIVTNLARGHK